jgi:DNA-binding XRE family transcriptional regulator
MKRMKDLKAELLKDAAVRAEYERLGPEFELIRALIAARARAGLTQAELAERMGTTQSVVARLEGGSVTPNWKTLRRYAEATGSRLCVKLEAA